MITTYLTEEHRIPITRMFRKSTELWYSMYYSINGHEYQVYNFAPKNEDWSITTRVNKQNIINFLMGWANGASSMIKESKEAT